ncbi:hypothetical protein L596_020550 [Steinernema carpocapsae]|uniref:Bestrophin homolog n=1 Tax=Steinernema carpocapsae TaxID=34508 RepID=A0A4U5MUM4_STECR|nr:hypothetical protein L596_020550 [Steinernema carpocapsae]
MNMASNLGFIDLTAMHVCSYISGDDERGIMLRRNILRYVLFFQALAYRSISNVIFNRFPTLESFIAAGYITADELKKFNEIKEKRSPVNQLWVPLHWAFGLVSTARNENRITDHGMQDVFKRFVDFRGNVGTLLGFDCIPIPLLYTQVVCLTVRLYFIICLMGRQNLEQAIDNNYIDHFQIYVPVMTIFQFVFYMGWMKVAEALLNPLGDDDDDFEVNFLLDRNFQVAMAMSGQTDPPELVHDAFWESDIAVPMYSMATINTVVNPMIGSALLAEQEGRKMSGEVIMVPRDDTTVIDESRRSSAASLHFTVMDAMKRRFSRASQQDDEESVLRKRRSSFAAAVMAQKDKVKPRTTSESETQADFGSRHNDTSVRIVPDLQPVLETEEENGPQRLPDSSA